MTDDAKLDLDALDALARKLEGAPFGATVNLAPKAVLILTAAARERGALKTERDELRRELRKCTVNKDELWKIVRADFTKLQQAKADGEDVAQMLVQRDKEAETETAALRTKLDDGRGLSFVL